MLNPLYLRYRALLSALRQYVLTRGTLFIKDGIGIARGRSAYTETAIIQNVIKFCQIANGRIGNVDNAILYSIMGVSPDSKAMSQSQYVEDLLIHSLMGTSPDRKANMHAQYVEERLMHSINKIYTRGSGHSYNIVFGRGMSFVQFINKSSGRDITAENGSVSAILQCLYRASLNAANIEYSRSNSLDKLVVRSGLTSADIVYGDGAGLNFMKSCISAVSNAVNTSHGMGILMSEKVVGNSGISLEEPLESLMYAFGTVENHKVSFTTQDLDKYLGETLFKNYGSASAILLDLRVKMRGSIRSYLVLNGIIDQLDTIHLSGITENKIKTNAGIAIVEYGDIDSWLAPEQIDNNTYYIRSAYTMNQTDSEVYIR